MNCLLEKPIFKLDDKNFSTTQYEFLNMMLKRFPFLIVGGSSALYAFKLLDRAIGDFDFICPASKRSKIHHQLMNITNDESTKILDSLVSRGKTHIEYQYRNVKFCVFYEDEVNYYLCDYNGREDLVKIHDFQDIIKAKRRIENQTESDGEYYTAAASKHKSDLRFIKERLDDVVQMTKMQML